MVTREQCVAKYDEYKRANGGRIPKWREYLVFAKIPKGRLLALFGKEAYTRLQTAAGDTPNKLVLEPMPLETIMRQYGNLVIEVGAAPPYSEWAHRGLKPSDSGLAKNPHQITWSEFPQKFMEWVAGNSVQGFEKATEIIQKSQPPASSQRPDTGFSRLICDVRAWMPARRRNSEEAYKIELRKHLERLDYRLNEESGDSNVDLLVDRAFAIEIKKDPPSTEYDRCFGQVARHLQHHHRVIVLILESTRGDKYKGFVELVDRFLNVGESCVEVIGR
jgi:hypothetical protein